MLLTLNTHNVRYRINDFYMAFAHLFPRIYLSASGDDERYKFLALIFLGASADDSGTYRCSVSYRNPESDTVQTRENSIDIGLQGIIPKSSLSDQVEQ